MNSQEARDLYGSRTQPLCPETSSRRWRNTNSRTWLASMGLGVSLALIGCSGSSGGGSGAGSSSLDVDANAPVVAQLETIAGSVSPFIIKGTVPVPPKTFTKKNQVPFTVLDWDGAASPTQVEAVTFYPKISDGADVVEVLAKVHVPPTVAPGTKISYEVVLNPHKSDGFRLTEELQQVMKTPETIMLVAHDAFGHEYKLDLLKGAEKDFNNKGPNTLRSGEAAATMRTHGVLEPSDKGKIGQPNGPLHHMFGAHAYTTLWKDLGAVSLDLRVHNGLSGLDSSSSKDDPNAKLYFADLELWIPKGWTMFQQNPDPVLGTPYDQPNHRVFPIVEPLGGGKMHFMPLQGQFNRRLTLSMAGHEPVAQALVNELGRAFNKAGTSPTGGELWSWWNPQTGRYFPQRFTIADVSFLGNTTVEGKLSQELSKIRGLLASGASGNFPYTSSALGWAHPWGSAYGGMTGGSEIQQWDGIEAACTGSIDGYMLSQVTHRMYSDRQPQVLFNLDGQPTKFSQWVKSGANGPYLPMTFNQILKGSQDPFGFNQADTSHVSYVQQNNLQPPYEAELDNFKPVDFQHYTRYTRSAKVLTWLGNDSLAKDDLLMAAELYRLSYNMAAESAAGYVGPGMLNDWQDVQASPGTGFGFGRSEGWGLDTMNAAYSISDQEWRDDAISWFEENVDMAAQGQSSCNGYLQSIVSSKMLDGKYRTRQAIEQGICESALRGTVESVFRGVDSGRTAQTEYVLEKSFYSIISPMAWSSGQGPYSYLAVGPISKSQGTFCGSIPSDGSDGINHGQFYSSFAYAYELTGDQQFLQKAGEIFGAPNPSGLLSAIENQGFNLLDNRSALISACQNMGL